MMRAAATCLALALACGPTAAADYAAGAIASPRVTVPDRAARGLVVLVSDAAGWGDTEAGIAADLTASGAIVIGIDLPAWRTALDAQPRDCVYPVADIETISHAVQSGTAAYLSPIMAGIGAGGAQVLAMASQTPKATFGGTVAVDPEAVLPMAKPLCTSGAITEVAGGRRYGLAPGPLPDPVRIGLTPAASPDGAAAARALQADHPDVAVTDADGAAAAALAALLSTTLTAIDAAEDANPLGLPVTLLPATPTRDTLAVILSGDGGWRDLDQQLGGILQGMGIPVVGLDSLRYFWSEKTPAETAADLDRLITRQTAAWGVSHALLIGYSFGANVLPAAYNLLPAETRARVPLVSLLALTDSKSFQISMMGWLGVSGDGDSPAGDIAAMNPAIVQCIYGVEDEDDPCPDLMDQGVEIIRTEGGHHFDGDYNALARHIVEGLDRRLVRPSIEESAKP